MSVLRCIALVAVLAALGVSSAEEDHSSPMYGLSALPGQIKWPMNVRWRVVQNAASAGGAFVAVRFYWKAGQYAAIGFSPYNMHGYITACNVPAMDTGAAVCTDVIGHNGGGVTKNPNQYSRLLWAKTQDAGFVEAEIEIPVSAVNISYFNDGTTRLIFATSTWNSTSNMPEPHSAQNKLHMRVNLAAGTVATQSLPMATAASHIYQATPDFSVWWFIVYNTTMETSYSVFNYALSDATRWGGAAFNLGPELGVQGVACKFDTTAVCKDVKYDDNMHGTPAPHTFSKITYSSKSGGVGYISLSLPLPPSPGTDVTLRNSYFGAGKWDAVTNFPKDPDMGAEKFMRFDANEMHASNYLNTFELFPGHYYATWSIVQLQSGFKQFKMRAALVIKGDHFVGLGFANKSMGGPLVACHIPHSYSLQVVCRDFIGQDEGGVVVNPVQSTKIVTATSYPSSGFTEIIVDIDLAKFNVSAMAAVTEYQRMIFAYGTWDGATNKPTYHGPNATFFQVNIYSGATNGTAPSTVAPQTMAPATTTAAPATTTAAPAAMMLKQTTCTDNACSQGCQSESLPTGTCLGLTAGKGSAIATCHPTRGVVTLQVWTNLHCTGAAAQSENIPLDTCESNGGNGSGKDQCVPATEAVNMAAKIALRNPKHMMNKF